MSFLQLLQNLRLPAEVSAALFMISQVYQLLRLALDAAIRPGITARESRQVIQSARACVVLFLAAITTLLLTLVLLENVKT